MAAGDVSMDNVGEYFCFFSIKRFTFGSEYPTSNPQPGYLAPLMRRTFIPWGWDERGMDRQKAAGVAKGGTKASKDASAVQ